eukprot:scaffold408150_cov20-Prasinocladus_malaysianus.AAC.1
MMSKNEPTNPTEPSSYLGLAEKQPAGFWHFADNEASDETPNTNDQCQSIFMCDKTVAIKSIPQYTRTFAGDVQSLIRDR